MSQTFEDILKIRFFTALTSLLISTLLIYNDDVINSDGILYLRAAEGYLQGGLFEAVKRYDWPFFSILIAGVHQLTTLSLETSALLLNALAAVLLTDTLILMSARMLPNQRQVIIAAILILCFYSLNEYRNYIIRGMAYWAFCSLSLYQFMLYVESNAIKNATFWQLFALLAILFRIEGVVILLALPLYFLFTDRCSEAIKKILRINYLIIFGGLVGFFVVMNYMGSMSTDAFTKIASLFEYSDIPHTVSRLTSRAEILEARVLNKHTAEYGILILVSGLFTVLVFKLIKSMSFGYLAMFALSCWRSSPVSTNNKYLSLLIYFALINILILLVFLYTRYFSSTRYAMMALLSLLLLMLPRITSWVDEAWKFNKHKELTFVGLILFCYMANMMTSSGTKTYIKTTAEWASQNLSRQSKILTDDQFSHYYFRRHSRDHPIRLAKLAEYQRYDYLITREKIKNKKLHSMLQKMRLESIYCDQNKRGDKSCVYKVIQS